jgi:long-chain fatty acid transport protein
MTFPHAGDGVRGEPSGPRRGNGGARPRSASALALAVSLLAASAAHAGGLYLSEFGTPSMGTAGAGALAVASDASTALHNPAGMTRLDEHQLMLSVAPGIAVTKFDPAKDTPVPGGDGGNQGGFVPILSGSYAHKLSERWRLGVALLSVSGAVLDPRDNWAGRNQLTEVSLFSLSVSPTLAYRVNDWLSLGAGPGITYASLDMDLVAPGPLGREIGVDDADDVAVNANVSGLIELTPELRLGIGYLSETELDLSGHLKLFGFSPNIDLEFALPQVVRWDVFWQLNEKVALLAGGDWEDWSRLSKIPISFASIDVNGDTHFRDTWKAKAGLHYRLDERWLLQAGFSYDSSAVRNKHRTAALPIDRQLRYAIGAVHDYSDETQLGFSFQFTDLGEGRIRNAALRGKYKRNFILFLGLNVNWKGLPWQGWGTF